LRSVVRTCGPALAGFLAASRRFDGDSFLSEKIMSRFIARSLLTAAACVACAAAPIPNDRLAGTEASYRGAQEAGADSVPQAKLHLKFAEEGITRARKLIAEQRNDEAVQALDQARADAELAVGLARESQAEWEAQQAAEQIKALRANL
jgi:hypothetical protein